MVVFHVKHIGAFHPLSLRPVTEFPRKLPRGGGRGQTSAMRAVTGFQGRRLGNGMSPRCGTEYTGVAGP